MIEVDLARPAFFKGSLLPINPLAYHFNIPKSQSGPKKQKARSNHLITRSDSPLPAKN